MRRALALLVVAMTLVGCDGEDPEELARRARPLPSPTADAGTRSDENTNTYEARPTSARIKEGVPYEFRIYTHCGLETAPVDFDGSFWDIEAGEVGPAGEAPEGWDTPFDSGVMTLISEDEAEFNNLDGGVAKFTRHEDRLKEFGVCA